MEPRQVFRFRPATLRSETCVPHLWWPTHVEALHSRHPVCAACQTTQIQLGSLVSPPHSVGPVTSPFSCPVRLQRPVTPSLTQRHYHLLSPVISQFGAPASRFGSVALLGPSRLQCSSQHPSRLQRPFLQPNPRPARLQRPFGPSLTQRRAHLLCPAISQLEAPVSQYCSVTLLGPSRLQ